MTALELFNCDPLKSACIYVISRVGDDGRFMSPSKVGYSADTNTRLLQLQTACPFRINYFYELECPNREIAGRLEMTFKKTESDHCLYGEWVDLPPMEALRRLCLHYRRILVATYPNPADVAGYLEMAGVRTAEGRFRWA